MASAMRESRKARTCIYAIRIQSDTRCISCTKSHMLRYSRRDSRASTSADFGVRILFCAVLFTKVSASPALRRVIQNLIPAPGANLRQPSRTFIIVASALELTIRSTARPLLGRPLADAVRDTARLFPAHGLAPLQAEAQPRRKKGESRPHLWSRSPPIQISPVSLERTGHAA